jgi:aerotaxis receptor
MRNNGPVTQAEYVLPESEVIITHTDTASRITYANPAFLSSSEFSLEECLGQPQNIVRHPDMPKEAFADLWSTIRSGKSWSGIVKNRRKSGGFYWVRANITPMVAGNQIVGYMSVRAKPTRSEIASAERTYADMRAGRAANLRLQGGHIVDTSLLGKLRQLAHLSLKTGTWLVLGALSALLMGITVASFAGVSSGAIAWLSLLCASVAFGNMLYIQSQVVQPLLRLHRAAFSLLSGDTTTRIPIQGVSCIVAVAGAFEQVRVKLDGVLKDNMAAAAQVRGSVGCVLDANTDLSNRTNEHAASLEETAASLEEITATVTRNTDNAAQATVLAKQSEIATAQSRDVVKQVHATMVDISVSSKRISDIISIIDGIAFQTNLLALNAAVEAARAGDQGRGFAVVAQEVRNLAQRSASSAKEIRELIQTSSETVRRGGDLAEQAEASMQQVVESGTRVARVIAEIEGASREQAVGIEQINKAMAQMDDLTQRDAQMAQELISTAQTLQSQSDQMLAAISAFSMRRSHETSAATTVRTAHSTSTRESIDQAA